MRRMSDPAGRTARRERLREMLERLGLDVLVLRRSANFAWDMGGADNRVNHTSPFGGAGVGGTREREYLLAPPLQAPPKRPGGAPHPPGGGVPRHRDPPPPPPHAA